MLGRRLRRRLRHGVETPVSEPAAGFLTNDPVECQPVTASVSVDPTDGVVAAGADGAFCTPESQVLFLRRVHLRDPATSTRWSWRRASSRSGSTSRRASRSTAPTRRRSTRPMNVATSGCARQRTRLPEHRRRSSRPAGRLRNGQLAAGRMVGLRARSGFIGQDSLAYDLLGLRLRHLHRRRAGHGDRADRCDRNPARPPTRSPADTTTK